MDRSDNLLPAQCRFVEQLNHNAVGVGAVERSASVAVKLEGVDDLYAVRNKLLLQFFDSFDGFYHKAEVVKLQLSGGRGEFIASTTNTTTNVITI